MPGEDLHLSGWVRFEAHRAACTAGRAVRRADRTRTTEPGPGVVRVRLARLARRCAAPRRARYLLRVLLCVFVSL